MLLYKEEMMVERNKVEQAKPNSKMKKAATPACARSLQQATQRSSNSSSPDQQQEEQVRAVAALLKRKVKRWRRDTRTKKNPADGIFGFRKISDTL